MYTIRKKDDVEGSVWVASFENDFDRGQFLDLLRKLRPEETYYRGY